jgi:hypothetical protein
MPGDDLIWWHFGWPQETRSSLWRPPVPRQYDVGEDQSAPCYAVIDKVERATEVPYTGDRDHP